MAATAGTLVGVAAALVGVGGTAVGVGGAVVAVGGTLVAVAAGGALVDIKPENILLGQGGALVADAVVGAAAGVLAHAEPIRSAGANRDSRSCRRKKSLLRLLSNDLSEGARVGVEVL